MFGFGGSGVHAVVVRWAPQKKVGCQGYDMKYLTWSVWDNVVGQAIVLFRIELALAIPEAIYEE